MAKVVASRPFWGIVGLTSEGIGCLHTSLLQMYHLLDDTSFDRQMSLTPIPGRDMVFIDSCGNHERKER